MGLFGKVELTSLMSAEEVKFEICQVFMIPMGLTKDDMANKCLFEFSYLQKTGLGSCSLCLPAVSHSFEWNGRHVASLAKSGGFIYILAAKELPGCNFEPSSTKVNIQHAYSNTHVHICMPSHICTVNKTTNVCAAAAAS